MKDKPRILIVNGALYTGGAENVTATLCRQLDRSRVEVFVAHLKGNGPIAQSLKAEGFPVFRLSEHDDGRRDIKSWWRLRRLVLDLGIDVVHSQDIHALTDCSICAATIPRMRHISTFHYGNYPRDNRRYHRLERFLLRAPDRLIAVGEAQRQAISKTYGLPPEAFRVIGNGVSDPDARKSVAEMARVRGDAKVVIGAVSTLIEQKGIHDLLAAAKILADQNVSFRLVVVGDGHLRNELEAVSRDLSLTEYVEFLGWVEDAASRVLPWLDVFVQSSLWEAMSMVVLEAMACRCAVLATTVGDNPYVIRDGVSGVLVAPRRPDLLAARLKELVQDRLMRERLASEARRDYELKYTASCMCRNYEQLYLDVVNPELGSLAVGS